MVRIKKLPIAYFREKFPALNSFRTLVHSDAFSTILVYLE